MMPCKECAKRRVPEAQWPRNRLRVGDAFYIRDDVHEVAKGQPRRIEIATWLGDHRSDIVWTVFRTGPRGARRWEAHRGNLGFQAAALSLSELRENVNLIMRW